MKRARREIKRLKTYLGRVFRDVRRRLEGRPEVAAHFAEPLARVERLLQQQRHDKNKLYALHAPEVACIAKGKPHHKYEFGAKVSVAVTNFKGALGDAIHALLCAGRPQPAPDPAPPGQASSRPAPPARRARQNRQDRLPVGLKSTYSGPTR